VEERRSYGNTYVSPRVANGGNMEKYANNASRSELLMENIKEQQ
jgi:hypothetical protein